MQKFGRFFKSILMRETKSFMSALPVILVGKHQDITLQKLSGNAKTTKMKPDC